MRILFFEESEVWTQLLPKGFEDAGHQVKVSGIPNEQKVVHLIQDFRPHLILSMGWGSCQGLDQQQWISKHSKAENIPNVYWSVEDPSWTQIFVLPLLQHLRPDFIFTICKSRLDYFEKQNIKAAYMDFGYNPNIHYYENTHPYDCSIAVVANSYHHDLIVDPSSYRLHCLKTLICPLLEKNIRIDFWGKDWEKMNQVIGYDIPNDWIHGQLPFLEANKVYSSAAIVLGLQNEYTQLTMRIYEILASEGFLLTTDTLGIRQSFKPGRDLIVSSCPDETLELVNYYLNHPFERERIRKQGKHTVSNHTYKHRAEYMIDVLKKEGILQKNLQ